ncbi:spore coat U domain-containing protein [Acinetobacter puyangensis]
MLSIKRLLFGFHHFLGSYMKNLITATLLATTGLFAGQSFAADKTASTNFQVKIQVLSTCEINATDIDFGSVNSNTAVADKTGNLNVTCTNLTPYSVGLKGSGKMTHQTDGTATIDYQLFKASGDTAQWDNDNNQYSASGTGAVQTIPVLAKVSGSTNVRAGNYADTVTATVTY